MGKARRLKQDRRALEPEVAAAPAVTRPQPTTRPAVWPASLPLATYGPPLLIVLVGCVLYANSFAVPFLFDDQIEILNNPKINELESPLFYLTQSRGIVLLSLALNHWWSGLQIRSFHQLNLLVHLINGLLIYALVLTTLRLPFFSGRYAQRARTLALLVSLVFIAHPLETMAVTYIIQRAESIASMFYLASLLLYLRGVTAVDQRRHWLAYAGAVAAGLLGILTKEIVVTLPFMVLLYHFCFLSGGRQGPARRQWVIYALTLAVVGYALVLSWRYLIPATPLPSLLPRPSFEILTAGFVLEGVTAWQYFLTQFAVILTYLRLFFVPTHLVFDYGWPFVDSPWRADVIIPFLVLVAIVVAGVAAFRRYRLATFCIGWFFIILAPSSSLIPLKDAYFEHRMYLAIVGLAWLVVVGGADALQWAASRWQLSRVTLWRGGAVAAAAWIAVLGWQTIARNAVYADPLALATDSATKAPDNWRALYDLGNELRKRNREEEAIAVFKKSVEKDPKQGPPRIHLGIMYLQRGMLKDAEIVLWPATSAQETSVVAAAQRTLGFVFEGEGQWGRSRTAFEIAAELMPDWAMVRKHLARMNVKTKRWLEATKSYEEAMRLNKDMANSLRDEAAEPYFRLGFINYVGGKPEEAKNMLQTAVRYRPNFALAHHYLGLAYVQLGDWNNAENELATAVRLNPSDTAASDNLQAAREHNKLGFYYRLPKVD